MIELASLKRAGIGALGLAGLAAGIALAATASSARTDITPYLEVQQVLTADLNDGGDVLTYTSAAAGVNGSISTQRLEAQISYRYERRIAYNEDLFDDEVHSGIAQAHYQIVPGKVTLDGGAMAARSRADGRGPIFGFSSFDNQNVSEVYSVYAGPTLSTKVGEIDVGAQYQVGYVKVDDHGLAGLPSVPGQEILDRYDSSISQNVSASVGMGPGRFPVGWTVGVGYVREDVNRLDQAFEGKYIRGDVVFPVTPTVALTAGVGYEKMQSEQDDLKRDAAGVPILTPGGNLIADPSKPRLLTYDQSGVIWDAGVIWRPSRRTELQARFGRRYGGTTITGSFRHEFNSALAIQANVVDSVSSFGRLLVDDLNGLPVDFNPNRNPLSPGIGGVGGCVFGREPGTGSCFDNAFQSINTNNFRMRGGNVLVSGGRGPWSLGAGAGYSRRKYLAPAIVAGEFDMDNVVDESFTLSGFASRELSRTSAVNLDVYAAWFDSSAPFSETAFSSGISGSYNQSIFNERLQGYAAVGLYTTDSGDFDSTGVTGLLGLRYTF
ncbi:MAG TPA: hypothetical protein VF589_03310 [Allosphingosinicella sp.]|jgi:hypothetical protein